MSSYSIWGCQCGKYYLSKKYVTATMVSLSLVMLYGCKYTLSSSLVYLIHREPLNLTEDETCVRQHIESVKDETLYWGAGEQYYVNSAFYVGYVLCHIPSGVLCDMYGAKHFLSIGVLSSAIITIISSEVLTRTEWYFTAAIQGLLGSVQGICMPALLSLLSYFTPSYQRTFLVSYGYSGGGLGTMLSILISSRFTFDDRNWRTAFYIWSAVTIVWCLNFHYMVYSTPSTHPFITENEKKVLVNEVGTILPARFPWKGILTDSGIWALVVVQIGHNFLHFTIDTNLPTIFTRILAIDITTDPYLIIFPYVGQWFSTIGFGLLGDYLVHKNYLPVVYVRTLYCAIGTVIPHLFIILATYTQCNKFLIGVCLVFAMVTKGLVFAGLKPNIVDITRHYAGLVHAIHNGIPALSGFVSPQIVKYMCKRYTIQEWRKLMFFSLVVCLFTTTTYFVWSKGERADWDKVAPRKNKREIQINDEENSAKAMSNK